MPAGELPTTQSCITQLSESHRGCCHPISSQDALVVLKRELPNCLFRKHSSAHVDLRLACRALREALRPILSSDDGADSEASSDTDLGRMQRLPGQAFIQAAASLASNMAVQVKLRWLRGQTQLFALRKLDLLLGRSSCRLMRPWQATALPNGMEPAAQAAAQCCADRRSMQHADVTLSSY